MYEEVATELAYWSFDSELKDYKEPPDNAIYTDLSKFLCHHYGFWSVDKSAVILKGAETLTINFKQIIRIEGLFHESLGHDLLRSLTGLWKPTAIYFDSPSGPKRVYVRFHNDAKKEKASYWNNMLKSLINVS